LFFFSFIEFEGRYDKIAVLSAERAGALRILLFLCEKHTFGSLLAPRCDAGDAK
jgi:hypothetical protein